MENCEGGSLEKIIGDLSQQKEEAFRKLVTTIAAKVLLALEQLHSRKVIHRDLKVYNFLSEAFKSLDDFEWGSETCRFWNCMGPRIVLFSTRSIIKDSINKENDE